MTLNKHIYLSAKWRDAIEIIFGRFNEIRRTRQEAISSKLYRVEQVDAMEEMALNEISLVDNADTSCRESNITDHQRFAFATDEEEHLVAGLLHVWILTANNPLELCNIFYFIRR
ncbi:hypothetical protein HZH66_009649 [Vespula vulgaris]|uniref:Uncharacterized protein n=1 Tax=Vespula vulgaris TaxID=7454 RepID=A0A834JQR2_VESVU|nr:hypothetical protein HZH66_009649 [Vespula vulgaris]